MRCLLVATVVVTSFCAPGLSSAETKAITDGGSAITAAKTHLSEKCTASTPCTFEVQRDGKLWRVFVEFTMRNSPKEPVFKFPGGHAWLYLDENGNVVRYTGGQ